MNSIFQHTMFTVQMIESFFRFLICHHLAVIILFFHRESSFDCQFINTGLQHVKHLLVDSRSQGRLVDPFYCNLLLTVYYLQAISLRTEAHYPCTALFQLKQSRCFLIILVMCSTALSWEVVDIKIWLPIILAMVIEMAVKFLNQSFFYHRYEGM